MRRDRREDAYARAIVRNRELAPHTFDLYEALVTRRAPSDPDARQKLEILTVTLGEFAAHGREVSVEEETDVRQFLTILDWLDS